MICEANQLLALSSQHLAIWSKLSANGYSLTAKIPGGIF